MPTVGERTVHVRGLRELQRAFDVAGTGLKKELNEQLAGVAEPVRRAAEQRAATEIRNLSAGQPWAQMRAVVRRSLVYVAPVERGRRSRRNPALRRPNLAGLLMDRAMEPALTQTAAEVVERFDAMLDRVGQQWERV